MGRTYREAGVDEAAAARFVEAIRPVAAQTYTPAVIGGIGGFAGLFHLGADAFRDPVLVAASDGVGTKIEIARRLGRFSGIGYDLVAMCVNDIAVYGARPLFFLDYLATERFSMAQAQALIEGIAAACRACGCALIGGETAQMPGFYPDGRFDLAGFVVGGVEREALIEATGVTPGDTIVGIAASGFHANGFSLIRRVIAEAALDLGTILPETGVSLGESLLRPTPIYAPLLLELLGEGHPIHAMAHVTGGGIAGNLRRILPPGLTARIDPTRWRVPPLFAFLQRIGSIETAEMRGTFNMGIGFLLVTPEGDRIVEALQRRGQEAWRIGEVTRSSAGEIPQVRWEAG